MNHEWLDEFREETGQIIHDPFMRCLAAAIATVESGHGKKAIRSGDALNEIGYKAIAGEPSVTVETKEADGPGGALRTHHLEFRLFADRAHQARSLLYLLEQSAYFEASRLLFILAFYASYAPGRRAGLKTLVKIFNQYAGSERFPGVRPIRIAGGGPVFEGVQDINHRAAREAIEAFIEFTGQKPVEG